MAEDPRLFEIFLDVQRGLPRQGPGAEECTLKALSFCRDLPPRPAVLDIGCGPGMQTVALAKCLDGQITAVDIHPEYLAELKPRAKAAGLAERIEILAGDMNALPFPPASFDLVWSEGAAYVMGFDRALTAWHGLIRPGGYIAVSELVWLQADPPAEVAAFFAEEYPAMTDVDTALATVRSSGYEVAGHFTLPDSAWWTHYYLPLEAKLPNLAERYAGDDAALAIIESTRREIDVRRRFPDCYGYEFIVGRKQPRGGS